MELPHHATHLFIPFPSVIVLPSLHLHPTRPAFRWDGRMGYGADLDYQKQYQFSRCLSLSPLPPYRIGINGLFLPVDVTQALPVNSNFARWDEGTVHTIKSLRILT